MQTLVNVICMKWGHLYGPEYVNNLRAGVARHLARPHRFVCFTDDGSGLRPDVEVLPLPALGLPDGHQDRRWQKLAVFQRGLRQIEAGRILAERIDIVRADFADRPHR